VSLVLCLGGWSPIDWVFFFFLFFFFFNFQFSRQPLFNHSASSNTTTDKRQLRWTLHKVYLCFSFIFRIALAVRALSCSSRRRKERSHQSAVLNAGLTTTQCVRINPANIQYCTLPSSAQPLPYEPAPFSGRATPRQPAQSLHSFLSTLHAYVQPRCRHPHASFFLRGRLE
jgi:hypothetical protein